ncbi:DUF2207 domain-containing protein [Nonomuraea sp. NPDC048916]|uniref:DUF2207 domain-containing protein n=1 Tax=Nonomuraea sp. NPDC048916 TaxID=3154232 RepID=UPI00340090B2
MLTLTMTGVLAVTGVLPPLAAEPHYTLPRTAVTATVNADGTVSVVQEHTFTFTAESHGAYVDIPRAAHVTVGDVTVSEDALPYRRGGVAEPGADGPDGGYTEQPCAHSHRVVWHFTAAPRTTRTFRLGYTLRNAIIAYDRHAFLHLPVWGRYWPRDLDRLEVTVRLPRTEQAAGGVHEAFGQPARRLTTSVGEAGQVTTATAQRVPRGHAAALDLVFPRERLDLPPLGSRNVQRRDGADGAADLATLRSGGRLVTAAGGGACAQTGKEEAGPAWWRFGGLAAAATAVIMILGRLPQAVGRIRRTGLPDEHHNTHDRDALPDER